MKFFSYLSFDDIIVAYIFGFIMHGECLYFSSLSRFLKTFLIIYFKKFSLKQLGHCSSSIIVFGEAHESTPMLTKRLQCYPCLVKMSDCCQSAVIPQFRCSHKPIANCNVL